MDLSDLSAAELSRIDAICLEYETRLRAGDDPNIDELVAQHGGSNAEVLLQELESIRNELAESAETTDSASNTFFDPIQLPTPGTKIGPYLVEDILGRGGMGVVFKAFDQRLNRKVAIKVLSIEIAKRRDLTERFDREARAVAAISHPNIVELFDVGIADGLPFAVMELLDGELLDAKLHAGAMTPIEVRHIGAQIADALATAHDAGVIHRDLKPNNVMLLSRNRGDQPDVKLFDFGLSRIPPSGWGNAEETGDGIILGTPGYMSPEQTRGEVVTSSSDVFSLGCVLFEAFHGTLAFDGPTKAKRFEATLKADPIVDPARRRNDPALDNLIRRCLSKQADQRPTAAEVSELLRQPSANPSSIGDQVAQGLAIGKATRRRMFELVGGGIAGAIIGGILYERGDPGNELTHIKSIAVLSFSDNSDTLPPEPTDTDSSVTTEEVDHPQSHLATLLNPPPLGKNRMRKGEQLSALLVHELTRLSAVSVPRFRPLTAETPGDLRMVGERLEVDALVTGDIKTLTQGTKQFLEIDVQIISARTGLELWGRQMRTESADNLLEQSKLATEIASVIGQRLTSTSEELAPPSVKSFSCLVDGKTRSDPDSLKGLEMALMCFQDAHVEDPQFADPIAGIALTSITLAAQTDSEKSIELIRQARNKSEEALRLDPSSIDARLAMAMLDWQTVGRFDKADREFQELVMVAPNNWQVHHQQGLLQLATKRRDQAMKSLREAAQLNPLSIALKIDRVRAIWFGGNIERAIQDATSIRDKYGDNSLARGLLIDIYEQQADYASAASLDNELEFPDGAEAKTYFDLRANRLAELPYGQFGSVANAAILQTRTESGVEDQTLAQWLLPLHPPMLPMLLQVHPALEQARSLEHAKDIMFQSSL